jgi:hypothetical protein
VEWVTPAFTQLVSEARQKSSTRAGTVSSAAIVSVGALAVSQIIADTMDECA